MQLQEKLDAFTSDLIKSGTISEPIVTRLIASIQDLVASGKSDPALKAGDASPSFTLPDESGASVGSVTRDDLAAAHPAILAGGGYANKTYSLTGDPTISFVDILSKVTGKTLPSVKISEQEYLAAVGKSVPDFAAAFVLGWVRNKNAGGWQERTTDLETLIGHKPKTAAEFFRDDYLPRESA